jgi:TM2 domain-containing membrane protein YozV
MSDGPQPARQPEHGPADPGPPPPAWLQSPWPDQGTRPQTWPELPTVPGWHVSLEPSAWPEQPQPWPEQPQPWPQQPAAWPQEPPPWPQQPGAWPQEPAAPGHRPHGRAAAGQERYAIRPSPDRYGQRHAPAQQAQEWQPLPLPGQEIHQMTVAPKNPAVSVLLSLVIPGLGSMVNDNASTGVTILILNIIGWMLAIMLIGIPLAIGTWIWGLVDAYQSAQRWNRTHGIIS